MRIPPIHRIWADTRRIAQAALILALLGVGLLIWQSLPDSTPAEPIIPATTTTIPPLPDLDTDGDGHLDDPLRYSAPPPEPAGCTKTCPWCCFCCTALPCSKCHSGCRHDCVGVTAPDSPEMRLLDDLDDIMRTHAETALDAPVDSWWPRFPHGGDCPLFCADVITDAAAAAGAVEPANACNILLGWPACCIDARCCRDHTSCDDARAAVVAELLARSHDPDLITSLTAAVEAAHQCQEAS